MRINPLAWFWGLAKTVSLAASTGADANSSTIANTSGADLYLHKLRATAYLTSTTSSGIAGTPLLTTASPTIGSNTLMANTLVTLQLKIGNQTLWSQAVSLATLMGIDGKGFEWELVLPKLGKGQDLQYSFVNTHAVGVTVDLEIDTIAVEPGQPPFVQD